MKGVKLKKLCIYLCILLTYTLVIFCFYYGPHLWDLRQKIQMLDSDFNYNPEQQDQDKMRSVRWRQDINLIPLKEIKGMSHKGMSHNPNASL